MNQKYKYSVRKVLNFILETNQNNLNRVASAESMLQEKVEIKWCLKTNEIYCYLDNFGEIGTHVFRNDDVDMWLAKIGNCFPYTEQGKKQAEEYKQKLISLGGTK